MCEQIEKYAEEMAVEREINIMIKTCITLDTSREKNHRNGM